jgi:hypothetical protein
MVMIIKLIDFIKDNFRIMLMIESMIKLGIMGEIVIGLIIGEIGVDLLAMIMINLGIKFM